MGAVSPGDRLGPYEILSSIGAGGMGEVFKARDTRLGRTVAIKVATGTFTERFEREARAVAALSHPNVCTLYDVGPDYLVMEYIDGRPLKGPVPLETVLRYAREIASALHAAHRLNIVHRDLKPANIMVTKGGIKLLDFGLAKMQSPVSGSDETVTRALTEQGAILGTLQYMSPEQLEGKDADARSDIFSFGCVLYEMITGRMAFEGESKASIIAAILDREPQPLTGVPPALARAIQRAMAKDPEERWQSARDLAATLELAAVAAPAAIQAAPAVRKSKLLLAALAAVAVVAASSSVWLATRTPIDLAWSGEPVGGPAAAMGPRVSPDGHTIAFQAMVGGQTQVGILKPETGNWTVLTHQKDLGAISELAWSRDGSKIYFDRLTDAPGGVFSIPVLGGEPRMVLEAAAYPQVFADGSLMVVRINQQRDAQLYRYWAESGKLEPLPGLVDPRANTASARTTPDGKSLVFYGVRSDSSGAHHEKGLFVFDIAGGAARALAPGVVFTASGIALAGKHDGRSVLVAAPSGSLSRVFEVPLSVGAATKTLFTLDNVPWYLDEAPDGAIYGDQVSFSTVLLRFTESGGSLEHLTPPYVPELIPVAVLQDGRPLVFTNAGARKRLVIVEPDGTFSPLVESDEKCGPPIALLGDRHVAVMTERKGEAAIVSIADGRIASRIQLTDGWPSTLSASPDGKTLYFTHDGFVWSIPVNGGKAGQLGPGDSVTADPNGRDLIVTLAEKERTRLVSMPVDGGAAAPIDVTGDVRMATAHLATRAIGPGGRIAVYGASTTQWTYFPAIVDPAAHTISRIPLSFEGEIDLPLWAPGGKLVARGKNYSYTIWRFHGEGH